MSKKMYFDSDGNGGFLVSKSMLTLLGFLFTLGGIIVSVTAYAVSVRSDMSNLQEKVDTINAYLSSAGPTHTQIIDSMKEKDASLEKQLAGIEPRITNIDNTLTEIKADLKELRNR